MFDWLINGMAYVLDFIYNIVGNYGGAIIIFTLIIKLILYPLTAKQTRSMREMQEIQPEIKKLQEEYKDDKEKQQEEMMKLYQEHGVNPAAGCLPMIVQMAILIPLFRTINALGPKIENETFLWISSLGEKDIALVILTGLVMLGQTFITQKISGGEGQSNKMMYMMPIFIVVIGFNLPAGVLLYWFTSTLFTVGQQYFLSKEPSKIKGDTE